MQKDTKNLQRWGNGGGNTGRMREKWVRGFTLIELLVVLSVVAVLMGLVLPALGMARGAAKGTVCASNLRQMCQALATYTQDNRDRLFPLYEDVAGGRLWWFGYEATGGPTQEGQRILDRTQNRLWKYYEKPDSIEVCPGFDIKSAYYKPKYATNWTTYGVSLKLAGVPTPADVRKISKPGETVAFADCGQVNTWQSPASLANPMLEQWYYISKNDWTVYYNHGNKANAVMFDGRVVQLEAVLGVNGKVPGGKVGRPPGWVKLTVP